MLIPRGRPRIPKAALAACALAAALGTAGCASASASQTPAIQAATAYVPVPITPGTTDIYLAIRNNDSSPDSLESATLSVGGRISFREPAHSGGMHTVPAIGIPARNILRLIPDGPHLVITGAGAMQNGKVITLTLRFRHAGVVRVSALVTNPQDTGGDNAYMNMD
jgi:copper(I)-binding protein